MFESLFGFLSPKTKRMVSKEELAKMLKANPDTIKAFERAYKEQVLDQEVPGDFFQFNAKQVSEIKHSNDNIADVNLEAMIDKIVDEFVSETPIYRYNRKTNIQSVMQAAGLPDAESCVSLDDIKLLPTELRPQCTSHLQKRDIYAPSYDILLMQWRDSQDPKKPENMRRTSYHMFRQGLDILDIDPIMYEMIGTNPTSMGYWFPEIVKGVDGTDFFKIPSTTIIKVPMNILQLTRTDYSELTRTTIDIVDKFCYKVFDLKEYGDYFIKTGTYSSKFDFRNCHVTTPKEVRELGEYLLFIHSQACQMAGPLNVDANGKPKSIYGVSTTNEWVVREFIPDEDNEPTIYKGLPLHTEYRAFIDFDTDEVLGIYPYWDPDTMEKRFGEGADRNVHDMHDFATYQLAKDRLMERFDKNKDLVLSKLKEIIPNINLTGQWSLDIMQNGDTFWIIDMAVAETSAFYNKVPVEKRRPIVENWLPDLSNK